jgi:1-acyl-sn-glycerol-3-phosphate acyltransferase
MSSVITVICILFSLLFPTLMIVFTYPISKKWALFWSNYITNICARHLFATLRAYKHFYFLADYKSKENLPEQYLIISNHQSLLDIPVYFKFMKEKQVKFVAKDTLSTAPMVGPMLRCQKHCMIPRKGGMTIAMKRLEQFGRQILADKTQIPMIFPEGTRSKDGNLGTFYSAGFRRLEETVNLPIAVCALDGGWKISKLDEIMRNLYRGSYRVKVLKIYPAPKNKEEEKVMLDEAHDLIQKQLDEWRSLPADSKQV